MKIELGKIVENKTKMFLVPALKVYGSTFVSKFSNDVFKLSYGIHDTLLDGALDGRHPIFVLCDKAINSQRCWKAMEYLKNHSSYLTDYTLVQPSNGRLQMLVLDFPEEFHNSYEKFLEGKYSEMYTKEQIDNLFPNKESVAYKILTKDVSYMPVFIKKIEEMFNVKIEDKKNYITTELEFPYKMFRELEECEIFNCNIYK